MRKRHLQCRRLVALLLIKFPFCTYCVRRVNAALVMLEGKCSPLIISCHSFLFMTSTRPPRAITRLYSSYKSSTDFAIIGSRLMGVPGRDKGIVRFFNPMGKS